MKMRNYLLTIKKNSLDFTSINDLRNVLLEVEKKAPRSLHLFGEPTYELDSHQRLHIHIIVATNNTPYFKKFQKKGWTVHFCEFPLDDFDKVQNYLKKQGKVDNDGLEWESRAAHEYLFIK